MSSSRCEWLAPVLVAVVALAARVVCAAGTAEAPTVRHLVGDAAGYVAWGRSIAAGDWIGRESFYQAPLYPYVLGALFRIAGESTWVIRVAQAAWGAAACGLLAWFASRTFGRREGTIAGLTAALYGPGVYFDGIVQKASLSNLLICGLLAATAWARTGGAVAAIALGAAGSLLSLTRENALVWQLLIAAWLAIGEGNAKDEADSEGKRVRRGSRRGVRLAGYVLGSATVLVPVGVRNLAVGGEFSLTTFQAGPNFYIGNHRGADGRYVPLVRGHETPAHERRDAVAIAERESGRSLSAREVSRFWAAKALDEIGGDVVGWIRLMGMKLLLTWNRYEIGDVESPAVHRGSSRLLDGLFRVGHFGVIAPLAAVGAWATRRRWRELWVYHGMIVLMTLAVAAFYVLGRYRYPLVPVLIPFAAAGCVGLWGAWRAGRWRELTTAAGVGFATAIAVNISIQDERRLDALAVMNAGAALGEAGDIEGAAACFARATEAHPGSAEAHYNLGLALALRGEFAAAAKEYEQALSIEPGLVGAQYNLGVALEGSGRREEALAAYRRAVERDATDEEARSAVRRLSGD